MVLWSVVLTAALSLAAFAITWVVADASLAFSVLIGALLSTMIFAVGLIAIRGILAGPSQTTMAGALLLFLFQLGITAGGLTVLSRQSWVEMMALGIAFIVAGVIFQVGAVTGALRARVTVDPSAGTVVASAGAAASEAPAEAVAASASVPSGEEEVRR